jgi:ribonuclease HI
MGRGGGVIMGPGGIIETSFAWVLGLFSNNQAKAYALWKGLKISKGSCVQSLVVVRDSNTIINHMEFIVR